MYLENNQFLLKYATITKQLFSLLSFQQVSSNVALVGLFSITKVSIVTLLTKGGPYALFLSGIIFQLGSFIGATIGVFLNVFKVFKSAPSCP